MNLYRYREWEQAQLDERLAYGPTGFRERSCPLASEETGKEDKSRHTVTGRE